MLYSSVFWNSGAANVCVAAGGGGGGASARFIEGGATSSSGSSSVGASVSTTGASSSANASATEPHVVSSLFVKTRTTFASAASARPSPCTWPPNLNPKAL